MSYHIVAGAFREEANADKIFKRLSDQGYKARRIGVNKYGLYPVLYGSYATKADKAKKFKNGQSEAWLLVSPYNIKNHDGLDYPKAIRYLGCFLNLQLSALCS
jgi:hypothetical protein